MTAATAITLETVQQWIAQTEGWQRVQATEEAGEGVSVNELLHLAEQAEWAELDDCSDLPYAQEQILHPTGLHLGWGEAIAACTQAHPSARILFFNAYEDVSGESKS